MVFHVVLFRPKPGVSEAERAAMLGALSDASRRIPSVRRFHVGARTRHGPQYERMMKEDYPFAAVIEFDDLSGLQQYLGHPEHDKLGALFYELLESGLVYDYEMTAVT